MFFTIFAVDTLEISHFWRDIQISIEIIFAAMNFKNIKDDYSENFAEMLEKLLILTLPFYPENNSVSTIRIFNLKCPKSQALNDFLQTNSNSTHWVVFGVKRYIGRQYGSLVRWMIENDGADFCKKCAQVDYFYKTFVKEINEVVGLKHPINNLWGIN
jgi:hypothetical protein